MPRKVVHPKPQKKRVLEQRAGSIDVCGQRFAIEIYSSLEIEGECDYANGVLRLRRQAPDRMADTLLHEVLHAIFDASGMGWLLRGRFQLSKARYDALEENMIRMLCPALHSTLRNAGWLRLPRHPSRRR